MLISTFQDFTSHMVGCKHVVVPPSDHKETKQLKSKTQLTQLDFKSAVNFVVFAKVLVII